jgi:3-keto-5-aminohexanoate cleavage enzyme
VAPSSRNGSRGADAAKNTGATNVDKLVVTCAVTGSLTQRGSGKGQTPYLPVTPEEIATESRRAVDAGASVLHLHARDPVTGAPTADLAIFQAVVEAVRAACPGALINCTTGGGIGMTDEERIAIVPRVKPDLASFNMGSMTYGVYDPAAKKWLLDYPWMNSFTSMAYFGRVMRECATKPELEIYDVAMINNAQLLCEAGVLERPLHFQFVMGLPGQIIPATAKNLLHLIETARALDPQCTFSACAAGRYQFPIVTVAAIVGAANIRTGMEDNIYLAHGVLAKSNGELVEKTVRIARDIGREIASAEEARRILHLPERGD